MIDAEAGLLFFGGIIVGGAFGIIGSKYVTLQYMIKDAEKPDCLDENPESYIESLKSDYNWTKISLGGLVLVAALLFLLMVAIIESA
ncbi:hypothetical protein [Methanolobus profundi]|uniref:Uncharacterized protein n=1 Tax=Methanolobus profundi TaxID=487685 RepID=A0A1I4U374_9EURY|nr:hypothetical protein [Methanolobus profundi]SFM83153.1 hypothetical protein SAMN04488696_2515 [Methanolobus profundi]